MKPGASILLGFLFLAPAAWGADDGFRVYETTAATVNGEVLFVSDVEREACFLRCAAMPGTDAETLTLAQARDRLVLDTLALQEQRKLLLGTVDNTALEGYVREAASRMSACPSDCRKEISSGDLREWIRRKLLLRDFFNRRVSVFVEVKEEDVRKELERRTSAGDNVTGPTEDQVREEMLDAQVAKEIRNWKVRAASKARLILSPMEDR